MSFLFIPGGDSFAPSSSPSKQRKYSIASLLDREVKVGGETTARYVCCSV